MNMKFLAGAFAAAFALTGCVDTTGGPTYGNSSDGLNRVVMIMNHSGRMVYRFYGSNVDASTWEEDILGSDVLPSGESVAIDFDDGTGHCYFDFKVVFADGTSYSDYNNNVCQMSSYIVR